MRQCLYHLFACFLAAPLHAQAGSDAFQFHESPGRLEIRLEKQPIAIYRWDDPDIPRPYFCDVRAPDGTRITRNHPPDAAEDEGNDDHASFHPGIWLAFGNIGGLDVWRLKARVRHVEFVKRPGLRDGLATFTVRNAYEPLDGTAGAVCEETCRYELWQQGAGYYLRSHSEFRPTGESFSFGDQEEMGLGVRLATGFSKRHGGGFILNSEGGRNEDGTWGNVAAWCVGAKSAAGLYAGIQVIPGASNWRPSWFHNRDYGLIVANPFGKKSMTAPRDEKVAPDATRVTQEQPFTLVNAVYVFSGDTLPDFADIARAAQRVPKAESP